VTTRPDREWPWIPLAVFGLALAVRLVFVAEQSQSPLFDFRGVDADRYHEMAVGWLQGLWPGGRAFDWPPLYAIFLGSLYPWLGESVVTIKLVQAMIGAGSCVLVYGIALGSFGRRDGALAAALIASLCGTMVYFDAELLSANLDLFLQLLAVFLLLQAAARGRLFGWAAAGCVLGLSAILRGGALLFLPVVVVWILLLRRESRAGQGASRPPWLRVAAVVVPVLVVVAPVAWHNARYDVPLAEGGERLGAVMGPAEGRPADETLASFLAGGFLRTGSVAGFNLVLGNDPALVDANDVQNPKSLAWIGRVYHEPFLNGAATLAEHDSYMRERLARTIRASPLDWLRLLAHKGFQALHGAEIPRNRNLYADRQHSTLLRLLLWKGVLAFPSGILIPLGVVGIVLARGRWREHFLLLGLLAVQAAMLVGFFVTARYRVPLLGVLSIYAGYALVAWPAYTRARSSVWGKALPFGVLAILLLVSNFRVGPMPTEPFSFEYRAYGNHLRGEGRLEEAIAQYREAVRLGGEIAQNHLALGAALTASGESGEAASSYAAAARLEPDETRGWMNLGAAELDQGRVEPAIQAFQEAVRVDPSLAEAHQNLALALVRAGRGEEAKRHRSEARRLRREAQAER
jgi:tetratricopeptide (TPR) repeat protein